MSGSGPAWPEFPAEAPISFFQEAVPFPALSQERLRNWIRQVILQEDRTLVSLKFILCSDDYLHRLNVDFLQHDTLTDVITFPYRDPPWVEGEIYLSIDRIEDNARQLDQPPETEFLRVLIHGVLHLCGYGDQSPEEKASMTQRENEALRLWETTGGSE